MNDRIDCRPAVRKALNWIGENLAEFDPFHKGEPFEIRHSKKVCELAFMLYVYVELTSDRDSDQVLRILALLKDIRARREFQDWLLRSPEEFVACCDVYVILRRLGHDDPEQRELIQRVIDAGFLDQVERVPFRLMELRLSLELGDFRHTLPGLDALSTSSILAQVPRPLYLNKNASYALTHVIIFMYGFGTYQSVTPPFADLEGLRQALSALVVSACQERYWDLLGELLMCWDCLGFEESMVYVRAWQAFLGAQKEDGAFIGREPAEDIDQADAEAPEPALEEATFDLHYHTTIVGIVAGAHHAHTSGRPRLLLPAPQAAPTEESQAQSAQAALAAGRARRWLEQLLDRACREKTTPPDVFCRILLGRWVCSAVSDAADPAFAAVARQVWQELAARDGQPGMDFSKIAAGLRLLVAALLSSQALVVPSLQSFLRQAAEVLQAAPAADAVADISLCDKRVLLHRLGLHPMPLSVDAAEVTAFINSLPLPVSPAAIEELLLRILSCTAYGTRPVNLGPDALWIQEFLAGLATHFFRQYDLALGCRWLRAMRYLGIGFGQQFGACREFLYLHQRPEGAFGFYGIEEARLGKSLPTTFSADIDLYLPLTIECLWTLGEGSAGWRLYASLPRPGL